MFQGRPILAREAHPGEPGGGEWLTCWLKDQFARRYDPVLGESLPPGLVEIVAALRSEQAERD